MDDDGPPIIWHSALVLAAQIPSSSKQLILYLAWPISDWHIIPEVDLTEWAFQNTALKVWLHADKKSNLEEFTVPAGAWGCRNLQKNITMNAGRGNPLSEVALGFFGSFGKDGKYRF